ncbi:MAG: hypothetical protein ABEI52_10495 [Halobacteriaceae archaeon]
MSTIIAPLITTPPKVIAPFLKDIEGDSQVTSDQIPHNVRLMAAKISVWSCSEGVPTAQESLPDVNEGSVSMYCSLLLSAVLHIFYVAIDTIDWSGYESPLKRPLQQQFAISILEVQRIVCWPSIGRPLINLAKHYPL